MLPLTPASKRTKPTEMTSLTRGGTSSIHENNTHDSDYKRVTFLREGISGTLQNKPRSLNKSKRLYIALWLALVAFMAFGNYKYWTRPQQVIVQHIHDSDSASSDGAKFEFRFSSDAHPGPITGRLLVCIAKKYADSDEPRYLISDSTETQQIFGTDVFEFDPDKEMREINTSSLGYPVLRLKDIPEDEYWVQGVLHPYVLYNRSDNESLWLPSMDTFEYDAGILTSPGTIFSDPRLVHLSRDSTIDLWLNKVQAPSEPFADQELLKHVKFRSPMLSKFWGTNVYLKAWVLLPWQWETKSNVQYPLFIYHTHYAPDFEFDYRTTKPTEEKGKEKLYGYYLHTNWTSDAFKGQRGIIVQLQHANPYYDDSYAMNSANIGPYGDAITYEFIPYLEKKFRGIGQGWARTMYGGSTGGWESFAVQVFYPDEYNGCWSFCPDSFDFRKFQIVDLLDDENAYYVRGDWTTKRRGSVRNYLGQIMETMDEENHHEMVLGSRGRSGGQWDAWQAVYSPKGPDGFPAPIWDKLMGDINPEVVQYWEDHFDIRVKLQREWDIIGPKLIGKLHIYVGVTDSFYLNDAVYYLEDFLEKTVPYYNGSIEYGIKNGKGYEHCWTGSYNQSISMAWNTLNQRMIPKMIEHIVNTAPPGADLSFTSY